jgi:hypothetical protein
MSEFTPDKILKGMSRASFMADKVISIQQNHQAGMISRATVVAPMAPTVTASTTANNAMAIGSSTPGGGGKRKRPIDEASVVVPSLMEPSKKVLKRSDGSALDDSTEDEFEKSSGDLELEESTEDELENSS